MYQKIEPPLRMTSYEARERFPDSYILIRMDSTSLSDNMGTVLYIGDDGDELFAVAVRLDDPNLCGVSEGVNIQRKYSLGGIVVG